MNPDQIKAIQTQAKAQGLYDGPIDGVMGPKTQAAIAALQSHSSSQAEAQKAAAEAQAAQSKAEGDKAAAAATAQQAAAQNAATELERQKFEASQKTQNDANASRQKANDWANSTPGIAYNFATKVAPYGAGEVGGYLFGGTKIGTVGAAQTAKNQALQKMVAEGLGPESLDAAKTAGLIPASSSFMRAVSRAAPLAGPGLGLMGLGGLLRSDMMAPADEPEIGGDLRRGMGGFVQGVGGGLATRSLESAFAPKVAPDASAIQKIMASARAPQDDGADAAAAQDAARAEGMRQARMADINKMTAAQMKDELRGKAPVSGVKADLADRVYNTRYGGQQIAEDAAANVGRRSGLSRLASAFGPAAIGGGALLAAGAAQDEARARGATPEEAGIEAAKAGGTFGAGAAAGGYGLSRLAQALSGSAIGRVAGRALGPVAAGLTARDIYNWSTDPATIQAAQVQRDIYGGERHPGMMAPGDIERRYIDQQTQGPNVTIQNKTSPDAAMLGAAMQNPSKLGYGRQALARALLGQ